MPSPVMTLPSRLPPSRVQVDRWQPSAPAGHAAPSCGEYWMSRKSQIPPQRAPAEVVDSLQSPRMIGSLTGLAVVDTNSGSASRTLVEIVRYWFQGRFSSVCTPDVLPM